MWTDPFASALPGTMDAAPSAPSPPRFAKEGAADANGLPECQQRLEIPLLGQHDAQKVCCQFPSGRCTIANTIGKAPAIERREPAEMVCVNVQFASVEAPFLAWASLNHARNRLVLEPLNNFANEFKSGDGASSARSSWLVGTCALFFELIWRSLYDGLSWLCDRRWRTSETLCTIGDARSCRTVIDGEAARASQRIPLLSSDQQRPSSAQAFYEAASVPKTEETVKCNNSVDLNGTRSRCGSSTAPYAQLVLDRPPRLEIALSHCTVQTLKRDLLVLQVDDVLAGAKQRDQEKELGEPRCCKARRHGNTEVCITPSSSTDGDFAFFVSNLAAKIDARVFGGVRTTVSARSYRDEVEDSFNSLAKLNRSSVGVHKRATVSKLSGELQVRSAPAGIPRLGKRSASEIAGSSGPHVISLAVSGDGSVSGPQKKCVDKLTRTGVYQPHSEHNVKNAVTAVRVIPDSTLPHRVDEGLKEQKCVAAQSKKINLFRPSSIGDAGSRSMLNISPVGKDTYTNEVMECTVCDKMVLPNCETHDKDNSQSSTMSMNGSLMGSNDGITVFDRAESDKIARVLDSGQSGLPVCSTPFVAARVVEVRSATPASAGGRFEEETVGISTGSQPFLIHSLCSSEEKHKVQAHREIFQTTAAGAGRTPIRKSQRMYVRDPVVPLWQATGRSPSDVASREQSTMDNPCISSFSESLSSGKLEGCNSLRNDSVCNKVSTHMEFEERVVVEEEVHQNGNSERVHLGLSKNSVVPMLPHQLVGPMETSSQELLKSLTPPGRYGRCGSMDNDIKIHMAQRDAGVGSLGDVLYKNTTWLAGAAIEGADKAVVFPGGLQSREEFDSTRESEVVVEADRVSISKGKGSESSGTIQAVTTTGTEASVMTKTNSRMAVVEQSPSVLLNSWSKPPTYSEVSEGVCSSERLLSDASFSRQGHLEEIIPSPSSLSEAAASAGSYLEQALSEALSLKAVPSKDFFPEVDFLSTRSWEYANMSGTESDTAGVGMTTYALSSTNALETSAHQSVAFVGESHFDNLAEQLLPSERVGDSGVGMRLPSITQNEPAHRSGSRILSAQNLPVAPRPPALDTFVTSSNRMLSTTPPFSEVIVSETGVMRQVSVEDLCMEQNVTGDIIRVSNKGSPVEVIGSSSDQIPVVCERRSCQILSHSLITETLPITTPEVGGYSEPPVSKGEQRTRKFTDFEEVSVFNQAVSMSIEEFGDEKTSVVRKGDSLTLQLSSPSPISESRREVADEPIARCSKGSETMAVDNSSKVGNPTQLPQCEAPCTHDRTDTAVFEQKVSPTRSWISLRENAEGNQRVPSSVAASTKEITGSPLTMSISNPDDEGSRCGSSSVVETSTAHIECEASPLENFCVTFSVDLQRCAAEEIGNSHSVDPILTLIVDGHQAVSCSLIPDEEEIGASEVETSIFNRHDKINKDRSSSVSSTPAGRNESEVHPLEEPFLTSSVELQCCAAEEIENCHSVDPVLSPIVDGHQAVSCSLIPDEEEIGASEAKTSIFNRHDKINKDRSSSVSSTPAGRNESEVHPLEEPFLTSSVELQCCAAEEIESFHSVDPVLSPIVDGHQAVSCSLRPDEKEIGTSELKTSIFSGDDKINQDGNSSILSTPTGRNESEVHPLEEPFLTSSVELQCCTAEEIEDSHSVAPVLNPMADDNQAVSCSLIPDEEEIEGSQLETSISNQEKENNQDETSSLFGTPAGRNEFMAHKLEGASLTSTNPQRCATEEIGDSHSEAPVLKPIGILSGLGVGAVSILGDRITGSSLRRHRRRCSGEGSVASFEGSDYSGVSILRGTASVLADTGYWLRRRHASSVMGSSVLNGSKKYPKPPEGQSALREQKLSVALSGVGTGLTMRPRGPLTSIGDLGRTRKNATDIMQRLWRPMGHAAQEVMVSEWDRQEQAEREEALHAFLHCDEEHNSGRLEKSFHQGGSFARRRITSVIEEEIDDID